MVVERGAKRWNKTVHIETVYGSLMLAVEKRGDDFYVSPYKHCNISIFTDGADCINPDKGLDDVWNDIQQELLNRLNQPEEKFDPDWLDKLIANNGPLE